MRIKAKSVHYLFYYHSAEQSDEEKTPLSDTESVNY